MSQIWRRSRLVITLLLHVLRLLPFLVGDHRQLALENLALRQQLAVYRRTMPRPKLRTTDRLFWAGLVRIWTGWRQALLIVSPDTVLRWQRRRFREYWTRLSRRPTGGPPPLCSRLGLDRFLHRTDRSPRILTGYFGYLKAARSCRPPPDRRP
jgi:hypothetical protein